VLYFIMLSHILTYSILYFFVKCRTGLLA